MATSTQRVRIPVTLIPGDGIGPEITDAVLVVLDALAAPFDWDIQQAGSAALKRHGDPLPESTLESLRRTGLGLKGPLETPAGGGYRSVNVRLRNEFDLFANVRPSRSLIPSGRYEDVDIILIRENLEGLYVGIEGYIRVGDDPHAAAVALGMNSRAGSRRILEFAFEHALRLGRKKITIVHKANILKVLSGIFLETARVVAEKHAGRMQVEERIVDACAMQLVLDPSQFDVIVTTNLFGDILSDEIAGLIGGLGLAPGMNVGEKAAIFEAVHGTAPDIAGRGVANPLAMLLAAAFMLEHVAEAHLAGTLRAAIDRVLQGPIRTRDLGGSASTLEFARAIVAQLSSHSTLHRIS